MPKHPLAEVFGFPTDNVSSDATRYRKNKLCPYNNKVPSCTKDKAEDPLGVCSVYDNEAIAITCPIRFRQDWLIAHAWGRRQAVAVDSSFFQTLPAMEEIDQSEAEMAWLVYDLQLDQQQNRYRLVRSKTIYTRFDSALDKITKAEAGDMQTFIEHLQERLDQKLESGSAPDAPSLQDIITSEEL